MGMATIIYPTNHTPEVAPLFKVAAEACREAKFPVSDIEYESAINYAVAKSIMGYHPSRGCKPTTYAAICALRQCQKTRRTLEEWRKQDQAGAERGKWSQPTPTPIPLLDYEILSFVAHHGRKRARLLLGLSKLKLNRLLDEVSLRFERLHR